MLKFLEYISINKILTEEEIISLSHLEEELYL
jgi:hypothetical protein